MPAHRTVAPHHHAADPATPQTAPDPERSTVDQAPTSAGTGQPRPLRGVAYYAVAVLFFACLDATTKYVVQTYPVPMVAWMRYAGQFLLMTALLAPIHGTGLLVTTRTGLVIVRSMCLVTLTLFMTLGLKRLPLAEATSIVFIAPLLIVLLARPFLNERIGLTRWAAVLAGFVGVLLVARPTGALDAIGVGLVLVAAVLNAAYGLLSRVLSPTEKTINLLYYAALLGTVTFGIALPWTWGGPPPTLTYVLLLASLGVTGGLGHLFFTLAFREAPASLLAPVTYLQLVWAGLLGWLVFRQAPDALTLAGMAIIAAAGAAVTLFEQGRAHRARRRAARP